MTTELPPLPRLTLPNPDERCAALIARLAAGEPAEALLREAYWTGVADVQHAALAFFGGADELGERRTHGGPRSSSPPAPTRIQPKRKPEPVPLSASGLVLLNTKVRQFLNTGWEPALALAEAAKERGLILVRWYGSTCVLYRTKTRDRYVFGWTVGNVGFDNHVRDMGEIEL